jgi:hypothetical protein
VSNKSGHQYKTYITTRPCISEWNLERLTSNMILKDGHTISFKVHDNVIVNVRFVTIPQAVLTRSSFVTAATNKLRILNSNTLFRTYTSSGSGYCPNKKPRSVLRCSDISQSATTFSCEIYRRSALLNGRHPRLRCMFTSQSLSLYWRDVTSVRCPSD